MPRKVDQQCDYCDRMLTSQGRASHERSHILRGDPKKSTRRVSPFPTKLPTVRLDTVEEHLTKTLTPKQLLEKAFSDIRRRIDEINAELPKFESMLKEKDSLESDAVLLDQTLKELKSEPTETTPLERKLVKREEKFVHER